MHDLDLSDQRLLILPQDVRRLHLNLLNLSGNFLTSLPFTFTSASLMILNLARNRLSEKFPLQNLFINLPRLEEVDISENEIRESPGDLSHPVLKRFSLARNKLRILRRANWELPNLEILSLEETELAEIETGSAWEFSGSCRICMQGNYLQVVPELPLSSEVTHLDLSKNERLLVANVSALTHAVSADLSSCSIRNLTGRIPPSLTSLNLANNYIPSTARLPAGVDSLKELDLTGNSGDFIAKVSFDVFPTLRMFNRQRRFDRHVAHDDLSEILVKENPNLEISIEPWEEVSRQVVMNPLTNDISIKLTKSPAETPPESPARPQRPAQPTTPPESPARPERPAQPTTPESPARPDGPAQPTTPPEVPTPLERHKPASPSHKSVTALLQSNAAGERSLDAKLERLISLRKARNIVQLDDSDDLPSTPKRKNDEPEFLPLRTLMLRRPLKDDGDGLIIPVAKNSADFVRLREIVGRQWRLVRAVRCFNRKRVEGLEGKLARLQLRSPLGRVETLFNLGENLSQILVDGFQTSPVILRFEISREPPGSRIRALVCGLIPGNTFETPLTLREAMKGVLPWTDIFKRGFDSVYFPGEHAYAVLHAPSSRLMPAYLVEVERSFNSTDQT